MPANKRCTSNGSAVVKNPVSAINTLANAEPTSKICTASKRLSSFGMLKAPSKYPSALTVFIAPAKV